MLTVNEAGWGPNSLVHPAPHPLLLHLNQAPSRCCSAVTHHVSGMVVIAHVQKGSGRGGALLGGRSWGNDVWGNPSVAICAKFGLLVVAIVGAPEGANRRACGLVLTV